MSLIKPRILILRESMDGDGTIPQRLKMMKHQEINVLQHIRDTEENLIKIQQKIARLEREMKKY